MKIKGGTDTFLITNYLIFSEYTSYFQFFSASPLIICSFCMGSQKVNFNVTFNGELFEAKFLSRRNYSNIFSVMGSLKKTWLVAVKLCENIGIFINKDDHRP